MHPSDSKRKLACQSGPLNLSQGAGLSVPADTSEAEATFRYLPSPQTLYHCAMSLASLVHPREHASASGEALETDPLLPSPYENEVLDADPFPTGSHQQQKKRFSIIRRYYAIAVITALACILLLVLLVAKTAVNIQAISSQCVVYDLLSFSLEKIGPTYFDTQITGSFTIDPDLILNFWYRTTIKSTMKIMGLLVVAPRPRMLLFAKCSDSSMPFVSVADFDVPQMVVDLSPRANNKYNMSIHTRPHPKNLLKLGRYVGPQKLKDGASLDLRIYGGATLRSRHIAFRTGELSIETTQIVSTLSFISGYELEHFSLLSSLDAIYVDGIVNVDSKMPFSTQLAPIKWDLLMDDCKQIPVKFGSWGTHSISVRPSAPLEVRFSGSVAEIPPELASECTNGYSPFNMMLKNYTEHKAVNLAVRVGADDTSSLPRWLIEVLNELLLHVSIVLPSLEFQPRVQALNTASLTIVGSKQDLLVQTLATVSGKLESIRGIGRSLLSFTGDIDMRKGQDETFLRGVSRSQNVLFLGNETSTDQFELGLASWNFTVLDPSVVGEILNNYLNRKILNSIFYADLVLPDLSVKTGLFDIRTHNISMHDIVVNESTFLRDICDSHGGSESVVPISRPIFSLRDLNMSIIEMTYEDSTQESIGMTCEVEFANPMGYALNIPGQELVSHFTVDGFHIGRATVSDLSIPANRAFRKSVDFTLTADSKAGRMKLERWLSQLVSTSVPSNIDRVTFNATGSPPIQRVLDMVSLVNVSMPQIDFQPVRNYDVNDKTGMPFVLRSIIHVLTSEIELTLFNPVSNLEVVATVIQALAKFNDILLGNLDHSELIKVPPGIHQSHRLAFSIDRGIGMDVLRRALNGNLPVDISATVRLTLGDFTVDLEVGGTGITCDIRV